MYPRSIRLSAALALLVACGGNDGSAPDGAAPDARRPDADLSPPTVFGGERPATLQVPSTYDAAVPAPLVVILHGYYTDPEYVTPYLRLETLAEDHGALVIAPDGLANPSGNYYWNGGACCDLYDAGTDDVAYLGSLITEIGDHYNVDPARVFVIGHSNGGFMAMRLACERADLITAAISLAGAAPATCAPSAPVSVLQVHGDGDATILYAGGQITNDDGSTRPYPSAAETVAIVGAGNGCDAATETLAPVDLTNTDGAETVVTRQTGCPAGVEAALWTAPGGGHLLLFANTVPALWWDWLAAHPRP